MAARPYRVEFAPSAARQFQDLPREVQRRLAPKIDALALDPRPRGCKKLKGDTRYRVRSGDYRVIYEVEDFVLLIIVVRVGHRREVYREG